MFRSIRSKRPAAARATANRWHPRLDRLDERTLPSVSAAMFDGTLFVKGSADDSASEAIRVVGTDWDGPSRPMAAVRVYDGATEVGAFYGVQHIDVRPGGYSIVEVNLNHYRDVDSLTFWELGEGTNVIRLGEGTLNSVAIFGGPGSEVVSTDGLNALAFEARAGAGSDHFRFGTGTIGELTVSEAESVFLTKTEVGTATLDNRQGTMVVQSTATIEGDLRVFTGTGSLTVGGTVRQDVDYVSFEPPAARRVGRAVAERILPERAELRVTGLVGGSVFMTGTTRDDVAIFAAGSSVDGTVELNLGAGDDSVWLGGAAGVFNEAAMLTVNMGEGQDSFMVLATARVMTPNAFIDLGAGDDRAVIEPGAHFWSLVIDGGSGRDTLDVGDMDRLIVRTGFESIVRPESEFTQ